MFIHNIKFTLSVAIRLYSSIKQSFEGNMLNTHHYRVINNVLHLYTVLYNPHLQLIFETLYAEIGVIGITNQWILRFVLYICQYIDVIFVMSSHITGNSTDYSTACSCLHHRAHQSCFVWILLRIGQYAKRDFMSWRHVKALPDRNVTPRIEVGLHYKKRGFSAQRIKSKMDCFILSFSPN